MTIRSALARTMTVSIAMIPIGIAFGILASPLIGLWPTIIMSAVVFAAGAQFAALGVLAGGGTPIMAGVAAALTHSRFLPLGIAIAGSTSGPWYRRAWTGAVMTDATFVVSRTADGRGFDRRVIEWGFVPQYIAWLGGTAVGAIGAGVLEDPDALGLDVMFPVFFLGLLLGEFKKISRDPSRGNRAMRGPALVAVGAAVITLATTPFLPPGGPVLAGALVALLGLIPAIGGPAARPVDDGPEGTTEPDQPEPPSDSEARS